MSLQPSNSEGSIQLSLDYRSAGGKEIEICAYHAKGLQINHIKSQGIYNKCKILSENKILNTNFFVKQNHSAHL